MALRLSKGKSGAFGSYDAKVMTLYKMTLFLHIRLLRPWERNPCLLRRQTVQCRVVNLYSLLESCLT
jgi:hypothetical protein